MAGQEIKHREGRLLDRLDRCHVQQRRLGGHPLHRRLAGAQHLRHGRQAYKFERTGALVQLHARAAQHRRIDDVHVGRADRRRFFEMPAQRLVRCFKRTAQLNLHPGQRAQVFSGVQHLMPP